MKTLEIAIIGGGTAGLACAVGLAQWGHRVVVFEKHATIAPVGAGILLQPAGVRALANFGLRCEDVSSPISRLVADNHRNQRLVDIEFAPDSPALGISRGALTGLLERRARELGVLFRLDTDVQRIIDYPGARKAYVEYGSPGDEPRRCSCDAVVLACGTNTQLATSHGFGALPAPYPWGALHGIVHVDDWQFETKLRQRVHGARRMAGLLPCGREDGKLKLSFFWSLRTSEYLAWADRPWQEFVQEVTTLWPEAAPALASMTREDQTFARYRHAMPSTFAHGRLALIGDAAHAMSPQLGLGTTLALEDAHALRLAIQKTQDVRCALAAYSAWRMPVARRKQRLSKLLTPLFQSEMPAWLRDPMFILGRRLPDVEKLMTASLRT